MGGKCKEGEDLDNLTRSCIPCRILCQQPIAKPRCAISCEVALCKAKPGHYYDRLVRRCIKCAEICGKHPAECSKHCPTPPPPVTTKRLPLDVGRQPGNPRLPPGTLEPHTLLYAALAVCTVLLLSSLCLASVVLLRRRKAKNSNTKPASTTEQKQKCAVQAEQESGCPGSQARRTPNDFLPSSSYPTYHEPSEDSYPTETCVCVHCFPDLRGSATTVAGRREHRTPSTSRASFTEPTSKMKVPRGPGRARLRQVRRSSWRQRWDEVRRQK